MGRKTITSFERVRVFGEEYSVKTPSSIPPIYVLKKEGTVCHIDMRDMEWIVKLASKYRRYEELHTPLSTNISGIIIHPDETLQQYDLNLIDISELTDLIMKVTYLKSKSTNQVYVLDCYQKGRSKCFVQTICNVEKEVAEPYIIKPNPIPFIDSTRIKSNSEIASAIMLGVKIYLNLKKYINFGDELEEARCGESSEIYIRRITLLGKEIV